jgi:lysophospholipase L1-like esterase
MKLIAIGDSITYGQNVRASEAWPAVLERLTGHDVRNAGVCGDTTRLGLERFPRDVLLHKPRVVVIQFGHNDANMWASDPGVPRVSAEAYVANIYDMVARVGKSGAAAIVLQPHACPGLDDAYTGRLFNYWAGVRMSEGRDAKVSVPVKVSAPKISLLEDGYGLHPDPLMHERYAQAVAAALPL